MNDAAESINTGDDAYQREERAIDMRRLKTEKFQLQRGVKNADEDLKVALDTVDSKDDEATADDREQVELATEALEAATAKLAEVELSLANAIEVSPSVRVFCSLFISLCLSPSLSLSLCLSLCVSLSLSFSLYLSLTQVVEGSPAMIMGVRGGDLIVGVQGNEVTSHAAFLEVRYTTVL